EHDPFARLDLAAVVEPDAARDEQQVTLADGTIEERLAGPRDLDHARAVADDRLEDPQVRARRLHALLRDLADDGDVLPDLCVVGARDGARVLVAAWYVEKHVACGSDVELREELRALRADPLA